MKNTASGITGAAGVLPAGRQSDVSPQGQSLLVLKELGISVRAYAKSIGPYTVSEEEYHFSEISENSFYLPNNAIAEKAGEYVSALMSQCDSCGGIIECTADGLPAGLGEPVFSKLDAHFLPRQLCLLVL